MELRSRTWTFLRIAILVGALVTILFVAVQDETDGQTAVFYIDDDTEYASVDFDEAEGLDYPDDPERSGYTFGGWFYTTEPDSESIRFLASWVVDSYILTLDPCDGTPVYTCSFEYGETVVIPWMHQRTGYSHLGWAEAVPVVMPAHDVTLHAVWALNHHRITFADGDRIITDAMMEYGAPIPVPEVEPRTGFTFGGWDREVPGAVPDSDMEFRAVWSINSYTVFIDGAGGSGTDTITAEYGSALTVPDDPVRRGYRFTGWSGPFPDHMPAGDIHLTALWERIEYIFTADPGNGTDPVIRTLHYEDVIESVSTPAREGHTFTGWSDIIPDSMPDHDLTVTAQWSVNEYRITFIDPYGGSTGVAYPFGASVIPPEEPVRTGYTFVSWSDEIPSTMPAVDVRLTAVWSVNHYTMSFDTCGGSYVPPVSSESGASVSMTVIPVRQGYTFSGWDPQLPETLPSEDTEYTAVWSARTFTVTFDLCDGSDVRTVSGPMGSVITVPSVPTREGYSFITWDSDIPELMPDADLRICALWRADVYSVVFDTSGGSTIDRMRLEYGSAFPEPEVPVREGFTFSGWDPEVPRSMPSHDVRLEAVWTRNSYRVTFDTAGGQPMEPFEAVYGASLGIADATGREGYTFVCWDITVPATMPSHDLRFTAVWSVNAYRITFDTCGGSYIEPAYCDYGSEVCITSVPSREGYSFRGWAEDVPETMPSHDIVLSAEWTVNTYHAVFLDGEEIVDNVVEYGSQVRVPKFQRTGYTMEWDDEPPDSMPSHDVSCHAVWTVNRHTVVFRDGTREVSSAVCDYGTRLPYPELGRSGYSLGWDSEGELMPDSDLVVHSVWTPTAHTVTFDLGDSIKVVQFGYGSRIQVPEPVREGYAFVSWDSDVPAVMPDRDLEFSAVWVSDSPISDNQDNDDGPVHATGSDGSPVRFTRSDDRGPFGDVDARSVYVMENGRDGIGMIHVTLEVDVPEGSVPVIWVMVGGDVVELSSVSYSDGTASFDTDAEYWAYGIHRAETEEGFPSDIVYPIAVMMVAVFLASVAVVVIRRY